VYEYSRVTGGDGGTTTPGIQDNQEELNNLRSELEAKAGQEEELKKLRSELEAKTGQEEELAKLRSRLEEMRMHAEDPPKNEAYIECHHDRVPTRWVYCPLGYKTGCSKDVAYGSAEECRFD